MLCYKSFNSEKEILGKGQITSLFKFELKLNLSETNLTE